MASATTIVTVTETGQGKFAQRVEAGPHVFAADEPPAVGGTDTGPAPLQLMLASLGSCTSMTLRLYADRKGWDLGRIRVELSHARVPGEGGGPVDRIERTITVEAALSDEQRARLVEIADKCPMHRLFMAPDKRTVTAVR